MWLVERDPDREPGKKDIPEFFSPINLDKLIKISREKHKEREYYGISFKMKGTNINWWFYEEETREKYLEKIYEKLPRLDLGVNDISL